VIVGIPAVTPPTIPVVAPTVASAVLLLVQVPPPGVEFKVVVSPAQTVLVPVIAVGVRLTVSIMVV